MGLLTKINTSTLKSEISDILTGSKKGKIEDIRWGMLGDFVFSAYSWPYDYSQENEDEYANYPNLAGYVSRSKLYRKNTKVSFSFDMVQRDINEDTQQEQQVFEEDIVASLNYLYQQKNSGTPLELVLNNGELSIGFFSINKIALGVTEFDPNGRFYRSTQTLDLEEYAPEQIAKLLGKFERPNRFIGI
jgi:phage protein U